MRAHKGHGTPVTALIRADVPRERLHGKRLRILPPARVYAAAAGRRKSLRTAAAWQ
ncbi:hypothetical protein [Desulfovibrio sp.]|uniref:hypothetical protein n=1 Tax=Desulfovibrio sp. TaxID=885 RepID=UPI003D0FDB24